MRIISRQISCGVLIVGVVLTRDSLLKIAVSNSHRYKRHDLGTLQISCIHMYIYIYGHLARGSLESVGYLLGHIQVQGKKS